MRAKIAKHLQTHAFDERVMNISPEQLFVLYIHFASQEKREKDQLIDLVKTLNNIWAKNFSGLFDELKLFTNPEMFKRLQEIKELKTAREEISVENFEEIWQEIQGQIPSAYEEHSVEEQDVVLPQVDHDTEQFFAGWVPYMPKAERRDA